MAIDANREWTDPTCPVARTLDLVGDRWSLLIVRDAMDGAGSFTEFRNRLGIARNILADRLRRLVDQGILVTNTAPSGKRQVYELAEGGKDLLTTIVALRQWGERNAFEDNEPRSVLTDRDGHLVAELQPLTQTGELLSVEAAHVQRPDAEHR